MNSQLQDEWFDPETTTFGDRIAGGRELAGLSQDDLAERLGITLTTLESWEDDMSEPSARLLSRLAGLLNVSLSWLLTGEGEGPDAPDVTDLALDASELLIEIRDIRTQLVLSSDRLSRLEHNLRIRLKEKEVA